MSVYIRSFGSYVPKKRITNDDLSKIVDTTDEWIRSHTGIGSRHIADDAESVSDLALKAAHHALDAAGIDPEELSVIVLATATQDYTGFPSTACIVQHKLGAKNAAAFDIAAACSGFMYAVTIAEGLIATKGGYALVLSGEILSRAVDWTDRNTCVLFGDGAGAAVIAASPGKELPAESGQVLSTRIRSYGSDYDAIVMKNAGYRINADDNDRGKKPAIAMDGRRVYNFAVNEVSDMSLALLGQAGLGLDDVTWFVPHQANARIISAAAKRLGVDESRFFVDIEDYANTSAASIPIAICDMQSRGLLKRGDLVVSVGFGAGLTSGGILFRW
jgi:3-oxoacyl-[acyl-carrier-protein] synthase-3